MTHYVSVASLLLSVSFLVQTILMGELGYFHPYADPMRDLSTMIPTIPNPIRYEMYVLTFIIAALAFIRHRNNIKKLVKGEERKTYVFKKNKPE